MKALKKQDYEILHDQLKGCLRLTEDDSVKVKRMQSLMMAFEKKKYLNQTSKTNKKHGITQR
ncbi:MAG: hypothetical protein ACOYOV_09060 [Bacteroidales bacterium]